jgi:hypothetical protein
VASSARAATMLIMKVFFMVPPDIIFSETRIGLCIHNVANILLMLVIRSATKSVTHFADKFSIHPSGRTRPTTS